MREHIMSVTDNVKRGLKCLNYLNERPITEMAGLGLIYGNTGLGKTRFAKRMCLDGGHIYSYVKQNDTPKMLLKRILSRVCVNYGIDDPNYLIGSTNTLSDRLDEELNRQTRPDHLPLIFLDEIDYALERRRDELMGTIRDLVDHTAAIIVMIGEENARAKLSKLNRHYYGRCSYICEFKPITSADVRLIIKDIAEVDVDEGILGLAERIHNGDIRNVIKVIQRVEQIAATRSLKRVSLSDYEDHLRQGVEL